MRILKIYDGDYPWDVRVEKFLGTLVSAGHSVTLLARNREGRPLREHLDGTEIRRLSSAGRFESIVGFPAFFNPRWVSAAWRVARECRPERILVRDLPLAPLGAWLARRVGCPLIVDMAEPYPEALRSNWQFDNLGGFDHLTRNPRLADAVERWVVAGSPRTIVVSPEAGERLERVGLPAGRWTLVANTPDLPRTRRQAKQPANISESFRDRKLLIFTGILVGDRGVEVALRGLKQLQALTPDRFGLLVIGDGPARSQLEAEARALGVDAHAHFLGWIPHDDLPAYWARAEIGILPFHACTHIDTTLANKLFDYMAIGLPVVTSDARPMVRVLRETGAGLTFTAGDPDSFAQSVRAIADDPKRADEMRRSALEASDQTYNWARDSERLLAAVERP